MEQTIFVAETNISIQNGILPRQYQRAQQWASSLADSPNGKHGHSTFQTNVMALFTH
jgi:hypothetical protein